MGSEVQKGPRANKEKKGVQKPSQAEIKFNATTLGITFIKGKLCKGMSDRFRACFSMFEIE